MSTLKSSFKSSNRHSWQRALRSFLVALVMLFAAVAPISSAAALTPVSGNSPLLLPSTVVSVGDSISARPNPAESWTTGSPSGTTDVNSIRTRLQATRGTNVTVIVKAVAGKDSAYLSTMMRSAIAATSTDSLITLGIGGNDACANTVGEMTSTATYRSRISYSLGLAESAGRKLLVISIPDLYNLWSVGKEGPAAVQFWQANNVCPNMLGNPSSVAQADIDRRQAVRDRITEYNTQILNECAKRSGCSYDNGAVNAIPLALSDLGSDYFHPNASGQAKIAAAAWPAVQAIWPGVFSTPSSPQPTTSPDTTVPTSVVTSPTSGNTISGVTTITVTATDNVAVDKVLLYADGTIRLGQANDLGDNHYELTVNSTYISNGSHSVKAIAYDTSNLRKYSAPITVIVSN